MSLTTIDSTTTHTTPEGGTSSRLLPALVEVAVLAAVAVILLVAGALLSSAVVTASAVIPVLGAGFVGMHAVYRDALSI